VYQQDHAGIPFALQLSDFAHLPGFDRGSVTREERPGLSLTGCDREAGEPTAELTGAIGEHNLPLTD
jgi:hypothetical protein